MTIRFRATTVCALAAGTLLLAACSSQDDTITAENESAESVAEKVAKADIRPKAGRWEMEMQLEKMEIPGMPAEVQEAMKGQMGKVQTAATCLTEEEASKPEADFFKPGGSGCTYEKFTMGGGTIDAVMNCEQGGQKQKMTLNGTYSEDAYAMNVTADGEVAPGKPMSMAMRVASKRVGDCTGDEQG